jgi:hypothetical protein
MVRRQRNEKRVGFTFTQYLNTVGVSELPAKRQSPLAGNRSVLVSPRQPFNRSPV